MNFDPHDITPIPGSIALHDAVSSTSASSVAASSDDSRDIATQTTCIMNLETKINLLNISIEARKKLLLGLKNGFYHIIVDSQYDNFIKKLTEKTLNSNDIISKQQYASSGNRQSSNISLPVTFDNGDAIAIAKEIITKSINRGTIVLNNEKSFPFLGAIVINLQFKNLDLVNITNIANKNAYNSDAVNVYMIDNKMRGTIPLTEKQLSNLVISDVTIVPRDGITRDNGLAFLNALPPNKMSITGIQQLACILNKENNENNENNGCGELLTSLRNISGDVGQVGGIYANYRDLYIRERAYYNIQKGIKPNLIGGSVNNYKELYKQKKYEYITLKNNINGGKSSQHTTHNEYDNVSLNDKLKKSYLTSKQEYIDAKNKNMLKNLYKTSK